jgi:polysaccharide chain length determinant protein (PEP-CTERM system associated)
MRISIEHLMKVVGQELFLRRHIVAAIFVAVNVMGAMVALTWPEGYTSSTMLYVEERNILDPLMQGAAVRTPVVDRSRIATEVIYGRKVMHQLAEGLELFTADTSDIQKESIINRLRRKTKVLNPGRGLIRIEHTDTDPERAYHATQKLAELFIAESHEEKLRESKNAYEFIDKQVHEYHAKLMQAEQELKELRSDNIDVGVGPTGTDGVARINQLHSQRDATTQDLRESETRKNSIERQLSGESATALMLSRTGQYRTRLSELRTQLAALKLDYHDTHPDIIRVTHQIQDLEESIRIEEAKPKTPANTPGSQEQAAIHSPVYQQLRLELTQTQTRIDTLRARVAEINHQIQTEQTRSKQAQGGAAAMAEITRDYQVNSTLYQDLLRRRENALVSMNINRDRQGLGFTIQEEANLPVTPSGLLFVHVLLIGILLSFLLPVAAVAAVVFLDGRIRVASALVEHFKIPVLGTVPHMWAPADGVRLERDVQLGLMLAALTTITIVATIIFRAMG